jgi:hypothetical protein
MRVSTLWVHLWFGDYRIGGCDERAMPRACEFCDVRFLPWGEQTRFCSPTCQSFSVVLPEVKAAEEEGRKRNVQNHNRRARVRERHERH